MFGWIKAQTGFAKAKVRRLAKIYTAFYHDGGRLQPQTPRRSCGEHPMIGPRHPPPVIHLGSASPRHA
ncbi:MAG: hypothetical protein AAF354_15270, partial [Pseudomonadota bacterium]